MIVVKHGFGDQVKVRRRSVMGQQRFLQRGLRFICLLLFLMVPSITKAQSLDELYKRAAKEGTVNFYGTLAQINAEKILPVFEKRFPGVKVNQLDITSDQLVTRATTEARAGKTIGDIFQAPLKTVLQMRDQKLLLATTLPEAGDYPANMKDADWVASNLQFTVVAWNTNLVKAQEEPKEFDDLADARWKNRLIAEPRDVELLVGLARHKFKSDDRATALLKKIAANGVEFHKGHSDLTELLTAGQAALCLTCYAHQYPGRIKKGAPLKLLLSEGLGSIDATAIFKDAPHPNAALLFARWAAAKEGQAAYAEGGRAPAHPKMKPIDPIKPERVYALDAEDIKEYPKYEKAWKSIFHLR
jgi:iron(III) transport system substrate-binding protein